MKRGAYIIPVLAVLALAAAGCTGPGQEQHAKPETAVPHEHQGAGEAAVKEHQPVVGEPAVQEHHQGAGVAAVQEQHQAVGEPAVQEHHHGTGEPAVQEHHQETDKPVAATAAQSGGGEQKALPTTTTANSQTVCPVMAGKINPNLFAEKNGERIYVCCPACLPKVKQDFAGYKKKLETQGIVLAKAPGAAEKP